MRGEEFHRLCQDAGAGKERLVQNLDSMYTGKVVACDEDQLIVEAFGHRIEWSAERCRPIEGNVNPLGPPATP